MLSNQAEARGSGLPFSPAKWRPSCGCTVILLDTARKERCETMQCTSSNQHTSCTQCMEFTTTVCQVTSYTCTLLWIWR